MFKKTCLVFLATLFAAAFCFAGDVYDTTAGYDPTGANTTGNTYSYFTGIHQTMDDGVIVSGQTYPLSIYNIDLGWFNNLAGDPVDVIINFYNGPTAGITYVGQLYNNVVNTTNIGLNASSNPNFVGSVTIPYASGTATSGLHFQYYNLPTPLVFQSHYFTFEYMFVAHGSSPATLSSSAFSLFAPGAVNVGNNYDTFMFDANANGKYDSTYPTGGTTGEFYYFGTALPKKYARSYMALYSSIFYNITAVLQGWVGTTLPSATVTVDGGTPFTTTLTPVTGQPTQGTIFGVFVGGTGSHTVQVKVDGFLSETKTFTTNGANINATFDDSTSALTIAGPGLTPGDVNNDNVIDDTDLLAVINNFLGAPPAGTFDTNGDGVLDDTDLLAVINNFLAMGT